jgi:phage terminase large subunit-like protein
MAMRAETIRALHNMPPKARLAMLLGEKAKRATGRKIDRYYPDRGPLRRELYPKHLAFFKAGLSDRIRNVIAANRVGKTEGIGGYETTLHLTGEYPKWWPGKRFDRPISALTAGDTQETTRDIQQLKMMGPPGQYGTGLIPAKAIVDWTGGSLPESVDTVKVRHVSGGVSTLRFRSYEQGRKSFQGFELDIGWEDEEAPLEIHSEIVTRTMTTGGMVLGTFTPLKGLTALIKHCREVGNYELNITWEDVPHLSKEDKAEILKNTPAYLRDARSKGVPLLGSGLVFQVYEEDIAVDRIEPQDWWTCINGLDFGWDHPTAGVELWHDPETDIVYVAKAARERQMVPVLFAAQVKNWNSAPWAWPHDGLQHDKGSGKQLAQLYRDAGLPLTGDHAMFDDGTWGFEAGLLQMQERMVTGRWKVLRTLAPWWEEFRVYHREDGKVVKEMDDTISASRYALMMLRYAESQKTADWVRKSTHRRRNPINS